MDWTLDDMKVIGTLVWDKTALWLYIFKKSWGAWVAQSVKHLTLAQVMILQFMSSSPWSGSMLTA